MTDTTQQRLNMVDSQVRPADVTDRRVIRAMLEVPREVFAGPGVQAMAYMDDALPVSGPASGSGASGRTLLAPRTLAKLIQLADLEAESVVLDVGCATGYSAAVLAKIAGRVVALECDVGLADGARRALAGLGVGNVKIVQGPLGEGVAAEAPFDAILLNGSVPDAPQGLLDQLKDGGRLVGVIASGGQGRAQVWSRSGGAFASRAVFDAAADPLPGFERAAGFVF